MTTKRVLVVGSAPGPGFCGAETIAGILTGAGMKVTRSAEEEAVKRLDAGHFDVVVLTASSHFTEADVLSIDDFVEAGGGLVAVGAPGSLRGRSELLSGILGCRIAAHTAPFTMRVGASDPHHPIAHRLPEFQINDEMTVIERSPDAHAFLSTWYQGRMHAMGTTRSEGKGRVVVLANGRTPEALATPAWQQVLVRAVRYAAHEDWAKRTVKVGLIGYGGSFNMGKLHADSCQRARMQVTAVCDADPKRLATARAELGDSVRAYPDTTRMLADSDVDLCVIITPHQTHAALSIECLEAGRHVVTEKPYTITVDEATRVIETARRVGRMATVFHNRRWDGDFLAMKHLVSSGAIGDVFSIECFFGGYGEPRADWWRSSKELSGGAFYDWGAHFCDWVLNLMGHPIESVAGSFHKRVWPQVTNEDHCEAFVRFAGGRTAHIQHSSIAAIGRSRFRILGTKGGIEQRTAEPKDGLHVVRFEHGARVESTVPCFPSDWDAFWRNVGDHLVLGETLAVTPESARDVIAVLNLAEESSKQGGKPLGLPY